jgi:hypothetical protein
MYPVYIPVHKIKGQSAFQRQVTVKNNCVRYIRCCSFYVDLMTLCVSILLSGSDKTITRDVSRGCAPTQDSTPPQGGTQSGNGGEMSVIFMYKGHVGENVGNY